MRYKIPFLLLLFLTAYGCSSLRLATNRHDVKMLRIAQQIRNHYVDMVDAQTLTEAAIRGMVSELDPYSNYFNAIETRMLRERFQRNFFGTGAEVMMIADTLHVSHIIDDSPAQKAGLMWGDQLIYINNTLVAGVGITPQEFMELFQGERGATVDVSVLRRNSPDLIDFQVAFDRVSVRTIIAAYMLTDDIGYIRLSLFAANSHREFTEALQMLQTQGMEHLILDLTDNTGGQENAMTAIASEFLERGTPIGYRDGRRRIYRRELNTRRSGEMLSGRVVVLVNNETASASEILAGALQDWDRAVIVGRRTHGKSLGQRMFSQAGNTSLNLTIVRYRLPGGRIIQAPFDENDMETYRERIRNQIYHPENFNVDSIQLSDTYRFTTLVNNRTVFGGGGILPDYFVVMDSIVVTPFSRSLIEKNVIQSVAMIEVVDNRDELLYRYPDVTAFQNNFQLPEDMMDRVRELAKKREVEWNDEQFEAVYLLILNRLKAFMALGLYDLQAFHKILNEENRIFQEGLRIISDAERYENLLMGIGSNVRLPE